MTLSGGFAWLLWVFADIYFLIGFRSRIVVALDWLWAYVTFRRGARIFLAETGGAGWRSRGQCPDACNGRRGDQIMSTYDLASWVRTSSGLNAEEVINLLGVAIRVAVSGPRI